MNNYQQFLYSILTTYHLKQQDFLELMDNHCAIHVIHQDIQDQQDFLELMDNHCAIHVIHQDIQGQLRENTYWTFFTD